MRSRDRNRTIALENSIVVENTGLLYSLCSLSTGEPIDRFPARVADVNALGCEFFLSLCCFFLRSVLLTRLACSRRSQQDSYGVETRQWRKCSREEEETFDRLWRKTHSGVA